MIAGTLFKMDVNKNTKKFPEKHHIDCFLKVIDIIQLHQALKNKKDYITYRVQFLLLTNHQAKLSLSCNIAAFKYHKNC